MRTHSAYDDHSGIHRIKLCMFSCALLCFTNVGHASTWQLTSNSEVGFHIDSFGMNLVKGRFNTVQSALEFDLQQPERATAQVVLDINSVELNKPSYKSMVLGPDLFYAEKYKTATFKSTQFKGLGGHDYQIHGNLTLRGITRPITFKAKMSPRQGNPDLMDLEAFTIIRRSDFGMKKALGGIGEKVNIQVVGQWRNLD